MSLRKAIVCLIVINSVLASHRPGSNVTLLTTENFYDLVNNDNIWVVNFYSSKTKRNKKFAKEFALGANILRGVVKFGAVDIEEDAELAENSTINSKHLPIVKFYGITNDKYPKEYTGPHTAKDLVESILTDVLDKIRKQLGTKLPENLIQEVNDANFDKIITNSKEPWLVLFYAPWCEHCKEIKPIWALVASSLEKKVRCASLDATVNKVKAKEYEITAYPTMKLLPFEKKSPRHAFDYTQERSVESIVDWAMAKLPAPDIVQVINVDVFKKHCTKQELCIITALPSIFDCQADCRQKYLHILVQLGRKFKRQGWGWVWTEAKAQKGLEDVFNIGGFGYPALVALNPVKMKYSVFKGAFTKNKVADFLTELAKATAVGIEVDIVAKIVTVEAWDGNDLVNEEMHFQNEEADIKDEL